MPHAPNGSRHCFTTTSGKKTVMSTYPLDRSLVLLLYLVVAFAQAAWPICNSLNQTREDAKNQLIGAKRDWLKWFNQNNSTSSIKVYVYDKPPFNWLHSSCTDIENNENLSAYPLFKHSDDYWFAYQANRLPRNKSVIQRVLNPAEASIFIIPALLNLLMATQQFGGRTWHPTWAEFYCNFGGQRYNMPQLVAELDRQLALSPWYQRSKGYDHLILASHWHVTKVVRLFNKYKVLSHCSQIHFEGSTIERMPLASISLPNLYVGKRCSRDKQAVRTPMRSEPPKEMGFQFIGDIRKRTNKYKQSLIQQNGATLVRKTMCEAMKSLPMHIRRRSYCASSSFVGPVFEGICNETTTVACALPHNNSLHYCDNRRQDGNGAADKPCATETSTYCDSMHKATFVFHIRGDTLGSNRLWDAVNAGVVPVFTNPGQYKIVPFTNLWRKFTLMFNENTLKQPKGVPQAFRSIAQKARQRWPELVRFSQVGAKIVSWNIPGSRSLEAYIRLLVDRLVQTQCGTCEGRCIWTATATNSQCMSNSTAVQILRKGKQATLKYCQLSCQQHIFCRAIDYFPNRWCTLYSHACPTDVTDFDSHVASYRLERGMK